MNKQTPAWEMIDFPKSISLSNSNDRIVWHGTLSLNDNSIFVYLYNDGQGFYGLLRTPLALNLSFKTTHCGFDMELAKTEIIKQLKEYCKTTHTTCDKLMQDIIKLES